MLVGQRVIDGFVLFVYSMKNFIEIEYSMNDRFRSLVELRQIRIFQNSLTEGLDCLDVNLKEKNIPICGVVNFSDPLIDECLLVCLYLSQGNNLPEVLSFLSGRSLLDPCFNHDKIFPQKIVRHIDISLVVKKVDKLKKFDDLLFEHNSNLV